MSDVDLNIVELHEKQIGIKFDSFKPDWTLIDLRDLEEVIRVYMLGAAKYERDNWKFLENYDRRYFSALLRHCADLQEGHTVDPEFKTLVTAHIAWNALALLHKDMEELRITGKLDDHLNAIEQAYKRLQQEKKDKAK